MKSWQQKWTLGTTPQGVRIRYRTLSPSHLSPSAHTAWQGASSGHVPPPSLPFCLGHIYLGTPFCVLPEKLVDRNFPAPTTIGITLLPGSKARGKICSEIWGLFFWYLLAPLLHSSFHLQQNECFQFMIGGGVKGKRELEEYPGYKRKYLVKEIYRSCLQRCSCKHWFHHSLEWRRGGAPQRKIVMSAGCEKETVYVFYTNCEAEELLSVWGLENLLQIIQEPPLHEWEYINASVD